MNKNCVNVFCYKNKVVYPVYLSNQKFNDSIDLSLISINIVPHYVYIKDFNRLMFNKTKHEGKKYFCKICLQRFSSKSVLNKHKEECLLINGKQSVKLEKGFISFKNYSRQIPVPFNNYADFGCILKSVDADISKDDVSYTRKYQDHLPCSFAYKAVCVDHKYSKNVVLYREKDAVFKFIKSILNEYGFCRKVTKKHFHKN